LAAVPRGSVAAAAGSREDGNRNQKSTEVLSTQLRPLARLGRLTMGRLVAALDDGNVG